MMKVAAIGDLHSPDSTPGMHREFFSKIHEAAEVLVICGHLTNTGLPKEAELLAEDMKVCNIPVVGVLGNHDHESGQADEIRKILKTGNFIFLDEQSYMLKHVGFAGVKGFAGGFDKHMLASFGEEAIKKFVAEAIQESLKLENQLRALETKTKVVA